MIPLGILATTAGGAAAGAYELISTTTLSSTASSVTFSSIDQTYKHLQLRMVSRLTGTATFGVVNIRFNNDSATNYAIHRLLAIGNAPSTVASAGNTAQTATRGAYVTTGAHTASAFGAGYTDILDYTSTTKNKTTRTFSGFHSASASYQAVTIDSGLWLNTSAITRIDLVPTSDTFEIGSRFSLYGIRG